MFKFETFGFKKAERQGKAEEKFVPEAALHEDKESRSRFEKILKNIYIWTATTLTVGWIAYAGFEVKKDYDYNEKIKSERSLDDKKLEKEILQRVGGRALRGVNSGDHAAYRARSNEKKAPNIKNFEKAGIESTLLGRVWSESERGYPRGWINGAISKISCQTKEEGMDSEYGENLKNYKSIGSASQATREIKVVANDEKRKRLTKKELVESLDFVFGHEIGHNNDWETSQNLSLLERMELLLEVAKRMDSNQPFRSAASEMFKEPDYWQKIRNNDKEKERLLKAKEYWAELCEYYFGGPQWMERNFPDDYALVHKYVTKIDPGFNPYEARAKKDHIIKESYGKI